MQILKTTTNRAGMTVALVQNDRAEWAIMLDGELYSTCRSFEAARTAFHWHTL